MDPRRRLAAADRADSAFYAAVARIDVPALDSAMRPLPGAASCTRLWIGVGGLLALAGGVRCPGDVLAGALLGDLLARATVHASARLRS